MKYISIILIALTSLSAKAQYSDTITYTVQVINADSIRIYSTVYGDNEIDYKTEEVFDSTKCANRIILLDSLRIQDSLLYEGFEAAKIQMQNLENQHILKFNLQTILKDLLQTNQP